MKRHLAALAAALALAVLPPAASAYDAYAAKDVHLRAGPARDYPVVAILPAGTMLDVQGCLPDYSWCDVIGLGERGWVYAANVAYVYDGEPVPLIDYGPEIGITVFGFVLGDYWDHYYRGRPWYHDRYHWIHSPRPIQPPLPPRPRPPIVLPPPPRPPHSHPMPPPRPGPPGGQPPHQAPPTHIPPPRSAEPGRPPVTGGK
jgi:uncharacterized protein YraI